MSRHHICSWVAAIGFLGSVFLAPARSAACSCARYIRTWGFVSNGGLIPSNSRGLLWWGEFEGVTDTDRTLPVQIARASGEPLPVEYELVSKEPPRSLWLFRPQGGFKKGESYVFTARRTFLLDLGNEDQTVDVKVSYQAAVAPPGPVVLKVGQPSSGKLQIAKGVSCSETVTAAELPVEMDAPEGIGKFRDQLYFETLIDGNKWLPSSSVCNTILPGTSWRGKGADLLFSVFSSFGDASGLTPGHHVVELRASLPGTDILLTSKIEVQVSGGAIRLACPTS
jgi:hypothetical protein